MKTLRIIIFTLLVLFHLTLVLTLFSYGDFVKNIIDSNIDALQLVSLVTLMLLLFGQLMTVLVVNQQTRKMRKLENERDKIKAKLYDLQENKGQPAREPRSFGTNLFPKRISSRSESTEDNDDEYIG